MSNNHKSKDTKMIPNTLYLLGAICLVVGWTVCVWLLLNKFLTSKSFTLCFITVGVAAYVIANLPYIIEISLFPTKITRAVTDAKITIKDLKETMIQVSEQQIQIKDLLTDMERLKEEIRPPILKLTTNNSKKRDGGIAKILRLVPDKNEALAKTAILAIIVDNTNSKILRIECRNAGLVLQSKTQIEPDGKRALKVFNLPVPTPLDLEIVVSEPCKLVLLGSYVIEPKELEVELPSE